jgi:hypothetical protein
VDAILHKIHRCQNFPLGGGCEVFNFRIGNLVLIWLNYGTSPRSALVRDRHHFSYPCNKYTHAAEGHGWDVMII